MKTEVIRLYENREDVTLTTYIVEDSPELLDGKKRPAVLVCPGGAYLNCSDREGEPVALKFVSMGYHAFVLRYSTYLEGKPGFPDLSEPAPAKEFCQHPTPVREIGQAMLIIREHGEEWLVDTEKIAVCGFSAGGHNAAMYAAYWHTDLISGYFHEDREKFRPAAAILGYPLTDYVFMKENTGKSSPADAAFFAFSNNAFLGSPVPSDEVLDEVSPARHVTKYMPPVFLWATAADTLVPVQHTLRMAHALADQGIPFEVHIFEEGPHGLSLSDQSTAQARSQIYPDAAKWADLAEAWLEKRFALPLPEISSFEELLAAQARKE